MARPYRGRLLDHQGGAVLGDEHPGPVGRPGVEHRPPDLSGRRLQEPQAGRSRPGRPVTLAGRGAERSLVSPVHLGLRPGKDLETPVHLVAAVALPELGQDLGAPISDVEFHPLVGARSGEAHPPGARRR